MTWLLVIGIACLVIARMLKKHSEELRKEAEKREFDAWYHEVRRSEGYIDKILPLDDDDVRF